MSTTIHHEVLLPGAPERVYTALTNAEQHGAFTGAKSTIDARPGGAFSQHDGQIEGFTLELVPGERLVQAWRVAMWGPGVYTIVRYRFAAEGQGTRVILDHTGIPDGAYDGLNEGWKARYWGPLETYLGAG